MLQLAIRAAKEAAKISLDSFMKDNMLRYKSGHEAVTDIDFKCERAIRALIRQEFPEHSILGEEDGKEEGPSEYTWIIDPIDGTTNYSRGIRMYGISIALAKGKEVILGVVYNPLTDEMFAAERGKGAFLNGEKIIVSVRNELQRSVIYCTELFKTGEFVQELFDKVREFRITSSSAYETCLVACGRTEGFIKVTKHPVGFAAACLIVEEAGGRVTEFSGKNWDIDSKKLLISNGILHDEILRLIS